MNIGIRDFVEEMKSGIKGKRVSIKINHKLYGNQKVECNNVQTIDDESRLGFHINVTNQDIYIYKKELIDFGITKGTYYFADKLMCIELSTT